MNVKEGTENTLPVAIQAVEQAMQRLESRMSGGKIDWLRLELAGMDIDNWRKWQDSHAESIRSEALGMLPPQSSVCIMRTAKEKRLYDFAGWCWLRDALVGLYAWRDGHFIHDKPIKSLAFISRELAISILNHDRELPLGPGDLLPPGALRSR